MRTYLSISSTAIYRTRTLIKHKRKDAEERQATTGKFTPFVTFVAYRDGFARYIYTRESRHVIR